MRLIFCLSSHCSRALPSCTAQHNVFPVEDVHYFVFLHDLSLVRGVKLEQVAFVLTHCCLSIQEDRRTDEIDVTHVSQVKRPIEEDASTCKADSLQLLEFIGSIVNVQWAVATPDHTASCTLNQSAVEGRPGERGIRGGSRPQRYLSLVAVTPVLTHSCMNLNTYLEQRP